MLIVFVYYNVWYYTVKLYVLAIKSKNPGGKQGACYNYNILSGFYAETVHTTIYKNCFSASSSNVHFLVTLTFKNSLTYSCRVLL